MDGQENLTVQLRGCKRWSLCPSGLHDPLTNYHPSTSNLPSRQDRVGGYLRHGSLSKIITSMYNTHTHILPLGTNLISRSFDIHISHLLFSVIPSRLRNRVLHRGYSQAPLEPTDLTNVQSVMLRPGSFLYVPAGMYVPPSCWSIMF